jgi:serine/threonine protein kinase
MSDTSLAPASTRGPKARLKRYEILAPLGVGGTAELLLARATGPFGFTKLFAIKRIRQGLAQDRERLNQILNEGRIASTLQHTNIAQVFDVEAEGETVFLVMEYLHGRDLRAVTERAWGGAGAGIPLEHAIGIAIGACAGLHYAHEQRDADARPLDIVHRDVSPHNIIVTYEGGVKVIDFGIAKAKSLVEAPTFGKVRGKVGYMSPEQSLGEVLDRRSDVFGIGILLYEMTTGRMPFAAPDADRYFDAVLTTKPIPPSRLMAYPEELERIVLKALARDRETRYATARDVHRDLESFARSAGIHASQLALADFMAALFPEASAAFQRGREDCESLVGYVLAHETGESRQASPGDDATTLIHAQAGTVPPPPNASSSSMPEPPIPNAEPDDLAVDDEGRHSPWTFGETTSGAAARASRRVRSRAAAILAATLAVASLAWWGHRSTARDDVAAAAPSAKPSSVEESKTPEPTASIADSSPPPAAAPTSAPTARPVAPSATDRRAPMNATPRVMPDHRPRPRQDPRAARPAPVDPDAPLPR